MEKTDFVALTGKTFCTALSAERTVVLELVSVTNLTKPEGVQHARQEPFSLVFKGPKDGYLPDNTYAFTVEGRGETLIFVSAFEQDDHHIYYDAVFN